MTFRSAHFALLFVCEFQLIYSQNQGANGGNEEFKLTPIEPSTVCNYPELWLVPSAADTSCKRFSNAIHLEIAEVQVEAKSELTQISRHTCVNQCVGRLYARLESRNKFVEVDNRTIKVWPAKIRLPGCFTLSFEVDVLQTIELTPKNYFGRIEYQWWNIPDFQKLKCRGGDEMGCGGTGNNCYYCNICSSFTKIGSAIDDGKLTDAQANFAGQFRGLQCPQSPGRYRFQREFCFKDWRTLDQDENCKVDFFEKAGRGEGQYKEAVRSLQQSGFGTLYAKYFLSYNATAGQLEKRAKEEQYRTEQIRRHLKSKLKNPDDEHHPKYIEYLNRQIKSSLDAWHGSRGAETQKNFRTVGDDYWGFAKF